MPDPDDIELIGQVVRGDERAFLALYDRYCNYVYALNLRILHDPMLAEEVTQDTFLKLWSRSRQFLSERGSLLNWLLTIARRSALDRIRLEVRRPTLSNGIAPEEIWQNISEPDSVSDESRWRTMHFAIGSLTPEHKLLIEMAYYQGLSQSEIADMLGWPLGTVKTRLRAAMEQLRRNWGEK